MEANLFKSFGKGTKNIRTETNECVIYTRVSGAKQMDGMSLETQLNGTNAYSKKNNLLVREYFGGTYESAATDERKEFQRMIKYLKTTKYKISKVLVYSLERFSRNENSIWLSGQLRKLGTEIISVTQPIDTTNPSGIMQQKMLFIFGEFDNQLRRQKSMAGIKEHLLHGEWCARPPIGYDIVKINGERKIVANETALLIKKMFHWKSKERLPNVEIQKRLKAHQVSFNLNRISEILANPFYCGRMSHKALEGDVIEGKHEKLISEQLFLEVNNICAEKKLGLQTKVEHADISLKRFMKCHSCNQPMRGYEASSWNVLYYKCNTKGCKCNRNAIALNEKFEGLLTNHMVDKAYLPLIKEQLKVTFQEYNATIEENQEATKRQLTDLNKKLDRLEERFILEEITGEMYYKYKVKFEKEIEVIAKEMQENTIEMSKLDDYISFSLGFCSNLTEMWQLGDYNQRQELQNTFFEKGITYNRIKDECRSIEVNDFLLEASDLSKDLSNIVANNNSNATQTPVGAH